MNTPIIKVFVTKNCKFRAQVEDENSKYEVTVGGAEWHKGKGSEYRTEILTKCLKIVEYLNSQLLKTV